MDNESRQPTVTDLRGPMERAVTCAMAQLRHLYQHMTDGSVTDTGEAARGLLGPAISIMEEQHIVELARAADIEPEDVSVCVESPCPFCGGSARMTRSRRFPSCPDDWPDAWAYVVTCNSCAAKGGWGKSMETALDRWDRRGASRARREEAEAEQRGDR